MLGCVFKKVKHEFQFWSISQKERRVTLAPVTVAADQVVQMLPIGPSESPFPNACGKVVPNYPALA